MRKAIIRVDGNIQIGLGHIYRGIALAKILSKKFDIEFVTRAETLLDPISKLDYKYKLIPVQIKLYQESKWLNDNYSQKDIIILDGYQFDQKYQQNLKDLKFKLVYIDDIAQGLQKADVVINHSPGVLKSDYLLEEYTKLALGTKYSILRKSFLDAAKKSRKLKNIETIFICFGGADIYNLTYLFTEALCEIKSINRVNIVLGAAYNHKNIHKLKCNNNQIKIYQNLSEEELIKVMKNSQVAIIPASSLLVEFIAVKGILLSGYTAKNQKQYFVNTLNEKVFYGMGDLLKLNKKEIIKIVSKALNSDFNTMLDNQHKLIDGSSDARILELIDSL